MACGFAATGIVSAEALAAPAASVTFVEAFAASPVQPEVTAVGLRAAESPLPESVNVLVLVDTSASQAGSYRNEPSVPSTVFWLPRGPATGSQSPPWTWLASLWRMDFTPPTPPN